MVIPRCLWNGAFLGGRTTGTAYRMTPRLSVPCWTAILAMASWTAVAPPPASAAEALLLIEADTGKVLHADRATTPWYPASITKIMTAYVALRAVKEGRMTLESVLKVSV